MGTGPRDAAELPRQPARHRLRPEQLGARLRGRAGRRAARLRQDAGPRNPNRRSPRRPAAPTYTSIAFAGSEAIVAYRRLVHRTATAYDRRTASSTTARLAASTRAQPRRSVRRLHRGRSPGLPDGGAAFTASNRRGQIFERQSPGAPGRRRPRPYPGVGAPGLDRAVPRRRRAARRSAPEACRTPSSSKANRRPPPGFPPNLAPPYPIPASRKAACCARPRPAGATRSTNSTTSNEPPGEYATLRQRLPARPGRGRAGRLERHAGLGGRRHHRQQQRAARHGRRLALSRRRQHPPGRGHVADLRAKRSQATFAIGGGAQCAAPCADRAEARIGPDVWLSHALSLAGSIAASAPSSTPARA